MSSTFYAVKVGKNPGIYNSWEDCQKQILKFPNAVFKKFNTEDQALNFLIAGINTTAADSNISDGLNLLPVEALNKPKMSKLGNLNDLNSKNSLSTIKLKNHPKPTSSTTGVELIDIDDDPSPNCSSKSNCVERYNQLRLEFNKLLERVEKLEQQSFQSSTLQANNNKRQANNNDKVTPKKQKTNSGEASKTLHVYTDGACSNNGRGNAKAGIGVYFGDDSCWNISEPLGGRPTNNRAEIHAAVRALEQIRKMPEIPEEIKLYTDSQFLINGITKWINKWKKNEWKLSTGEPVKNKEDFEALDSAREGLVVDFIHVKGHSGLKGNEEADRLAVNGMS